MSRRTHFQIVPVKDVPAPSTFDSFVQPDRKAASGRPCRRSRSCGVLEVKRERRLYFRRRKSRA